MPQQVRQLAEYIRTHKTLTLVPPTYGNYGHMGALLTDVALQSGINYTAVVLPRVQKLRKDHPEARTTSAFVQLLEDVGAEKLLQWTGRKLTTLKALAQLLMSVEVETEDDLKTWIDRPGNLARLRQIKGIKHKSADYILLLLGRENVAVDRHLYRFLEEAGLPTSNYGDAHALISAAAVLLGHSPSLLDHSIWLHMSTRQLPCATE